MIFVVKGDAENETSYMEFMQSYYFPPRVTFIFYLVQPSHPQYQRFPMNFLRSLGISNVQTTHYIALDIDLHPTSNHHLAFLYPLSQPLPRAHSPSSLHLRQSPSRGDPPDLLLPPCAQSLRLASILRLSVSLPSLFIIHQSQRDPPRNHRGTAALHPPRRLRLEQKRLSHACSGFDRLKRSSTSCRNGTCLRSPPSRASAASLRT